MASAAKKHGRRSRTLLITAAMLYVGVLVLVPVSALLVGAFERGILAFFSVLARPDVVSALGLTAKIALLTALINGTLGTLVAFVLVRDRFVGKRILNALVDVPFALSPIVVGLVLLTIFGRNGLLKPLTDKLGLEVIFNWPAMLIATVFVTLPMVVREVGPVLEEMGPDQELAARTLGASALTTFFRITLPSIRFGLAYGIILTVARAIGEFGAVLLVSGGVAGQTETATVFIYRALEDRDDQGAYAVAVVLAAASMALLLMMDVLRKKRGSSTIERGE
jgi:sulfate transport system permease protein